MLDRFGRTIDYARISITDRCNLRCVYCMPESGIPLFAHAGALTFEEIERAVRILAGLGIRHIRVTGGEPMARRGCLTLIEKIASVPGIDSVSMTTNGLLLRGHMKEARAAGLSAVNISIDTTDPILYERITRGGDVRIAMDALDEAIDAGLVTKVNAVPVRGYNDGDLVSVARLAEKRPIAVRFIELMPVGCAKGLTAIPTDEVRAMLTHALGTLQPDDGAHGHGPAVYFRPDGFAGSVGFIGALSREFCAGCNRVRVTSDGFVKLCLNRPDGIDLRALLRSDAGDGDIEAAVRDAIYNKPARHGFGETGDARLMNEIGG